MKKALILALFSLGFGNIHAQKLELGVHGGVGYSSIPQTGRDSVIPDGASSLPNYAFSIKAFTNVGNWQFGGGIDFQKIGIEAASTKYVFANPATTVYLAANRTFNYIFYAGADVGLIFVSSANYTKFADNNKIEPEIIYLEPGNGYAAGLHFGIKLYITRYLSFASELGGRYATYKYEYTTTDNAGNITTGTDNYSMIYPSLVVGLRLKLFTDPFNQWVPYKRVR